MEERMLNRSLIAYAFLAQAKRFEGDLLGGLAPIFKPIAKIFAGKRFDPSEFSKALSEIYGLKVNAWAVEDMAPRLEKAGVLVKILVAEGVHEYVYAEITEEFDEVSEQDIAVVIQRFIDFATPLLKQHGVEADARQLEDALLRKLVDMEFVGILIKPEKPYTSEQKTGVLTLKNPTDVDEHAAEIEAQARVDVLCASFILDAYHKEPRLYELILRLATGALVSEVVLNFQEPGSALSLNNLTVLLDTPLLMAALDLGNKDAYLVATALCEQLREQGAQLAVFSHSVDELKDNLKAVINEVDAGRGYGSTARRLPNKAFHAYASSLLLNPEIRLKQESIRIIAPLKSTSSQQYFSLEEEEAFAGRLCYYNKLAQERDAASVAAVIRLRSNRRTRMGNFPAAGYIFITSNPRFAERSYKYLLEKNVYSDGEVPPVISDRYFAGLMWVVYGGKSQDLPNHVLLANCARAVEPRNDVIRQMHRFLSELDGKQADYFNALMTDERAGQHLMQLTFGESTFITKENTSEILEQMKNALVEQHEAKNKEEIERIKNEHAAELARQLKIQEELRNKKLDTETENIQVRQALLEKNNKVENLESAVAEERSARLIEKKRAVERCAHFAIKKTNKLHFLISAIVASVGAIFTWYGLQESTDTTIKVINALVLWGIAFIGFWKVPDFLFAEKMKNYREKAFLRKLAETGHDGDETFFEIDWNRGLALVRKEDSQKESLISTGGK